MAAVFRSGKTGTAVVNAQSLALKTWTTNFTGANLDTTNFESQGFYQGVTGIMKLMWTLQGNWDSTENPTVDPPGLYPRDDGSAMTLGTSSLDATQVWSMPVFMVDHSDVSCDVNGVVTFNSGGTSQGSFSLPGFPALA